MPVPQIDQNYIAMSILPPSKRVNLKIGLPYKKWPATFKGISTGNVYIYDLFTKFMNGSSYSKYDPLVSYSKNDRVQTVFGVYESKSNANLGNSPTDTNYWYKVLNFFIGANTRIKFNFQRIVLEKGLNMEYGSTFRQPTSYSGTGQLPLSDIYLTKDELTKFSIISYPTLTNQNVIFTVPTGYYSFDTLHLGIASTYRFIVNIPSLVYSSIDANPVIAEKVVRAFVDKYCLVGVHYRIVTY